MNGDNFSLVFCEQPGKTHTMLGDVAYSYDGTPADGAGLIPRAVADIFAHDSSYDDDSGVDLTRRSVTVSFLEVYNEQVGAGVTTRRIFRTGDGFLPIQFQFGMISSLCFVLPPPPTPIWNDAPSLPPSSLQQSA